MRQTDIDKAEAVLVAITDDLHQRSLEHHAGVTITGFKIVYRGDIRWGIEWFDEANGAQTAYAMTLHAAWLALAHHISGTDVPPF